MLRSRLIPRLALTVLMLAIAFGTAQAAYRYLDDKGNACFTDDWRTIPVAYRASAEPPVPELPPAPATPQYRTTPSSASPPVDQPEVTPTTQPETEPPPAPPQGLWGKPEVRIATYVAAAIAFMVLLFKLVDLLPSPQLGRLILLLAFVGVVTYGYKLYVENMVDGYFAIKRKTTALMERAMKREMTQLPQDRPSTPPPAPAATPTAEQRRDGDLYR